MKSTQIIEYAKELVEAHGAKAEAEAAQRAIDADNAGKPDEAEQWRQVRAAIVKMRPAHSS